jgi:hypothetical protein
MNVQNLDAACAELGAALGASAERPKEVENSITKTLGVLEEQGVYAMFLYLHAREKPWGVDASKKLVNFLRQHPSEQEPLLASPGGGTDEPFPALRQLQKHLDNLLFARDLLHRALVYARYHAKAAGTK